MIDDSLLIRYIAHETTEAENKHIEQWRKDLPAHEKTFQDLQKIWEKAEALKNNLPAFDTQKAWEKLTQKIDFEKPETKVIPITKTRRLFSPLRAVGAVLLIATLGVAVYILSGRQGQEEVFAKITKTRKDTPTLTLEDKSTITLAQNAQITFPEKFSQKHRTIQFQGQAHFAIAPDRARPFIIKTNQNATIKVLGTSFWITAYPDTDRVEVNVTAGKVELASQTQQIILQAGESGIMAGKGNVIKTSTRDLETENRQKTYSLNFKDAPLPTVIEKLNKTCGTKFEISPELLHCSLTVNFDNQDIETILQILTETLEIKQTQGRQGITLLTGKGCL